MKAVSVLARLDWWVVLAAAAVAMIGCAFVRSATLEDAAFSGLYVKQILIFAIAVGSGLGLILIPYRKVLSSAWPLYALAVAMLVGLWFFGTRINGALRWYRLPGFSVQPSEFAKLAVIIALAAHLRFVANVRSLSRLMVPLAIAGLPAFLVMRQPDLGSALVFGPVALAMCYAAGAPTRSILWIVGVGLVVAAVGSLFLHGYQLQRIEAWSDHFAWGAGAEYQKEVRSTIQGAGFQPWQSLIAIGSGGFSGFGFAQGPQNLYGFLPYRFDDYIFAVVAEETGFAGACMLLGLQGLLAFGMFSIALRSRERFGRLLAVGVASYFATQTLMHTAVCTWLVPATGLPMPLVSYGGSSTMVSVWGIALVLNVGARREPVLSQDGFG